MANKSGDNKKQGSNTLLIAGLVGGGLLLLTCCCGAGVGGFFLFSGGGLGGLGKTDIVGRWEFNELGKLILDFRADGTGTLEVPDAKVRIRITHKLQGNELRIAPAPGEAAGFGERDAVDRLQQLRVSRSGDTLRLEALAGPGQGQVMQMKKIG